METTDKSRERRERNEFEDLFIIKGVFPMWYDLLVILGLFFITQSITLAIFDGMGWSELTVNTLKALATEVKTSPEQSMGKFVFLWTLISQSLMLFLTLAYRTIRKGNWGVVGFSYRGFNPTILLWGVLMILALNIVMDPILSLFPEPAIPSGRGIYMILAITIIVPFFEEVLCRGVILEAIRRKHGAWIACIASSVVFGCMHVQPQLAINAGVCGVILAYVYIRTRSIFAPILLHATNNIISYILIIFGVSRYSLGDIITDKNIFYLIYCAAIGIVVLSLISIFKRLKSYDVQVQSSRRRKHRRRKRSKEEILAIDVTAKEIIDENAPI